MTEIDYEARVAKGIALLDEKVPGWADKIDLEKLAISSGTHCVTAQVSGKHHYLNGMYMLGLSEGTDNTGSYTQHGFQVEDLDAPGMPEGYDTAEGYAALDLIWQREIAARQSSPVKEV